MGREKKRDELGGRVERHRLRRGESLPPPVKDERYLIDEEPEFVLTPLLATDPLPYLVDSAGDHVDAGGRTERNEGEPIPSAIRRLQGEASAQSDEN
jgi:hypothetical protein